MKQREQGNSGAEDGLVVRDLQFVGGYPSLTHCPSDGKPEFAFIGRSNVGKSSLVNVLLGRRNVARVSKQPGKTQELNYYLVNRSWYLVDLPGYGYAKVSRKRREKWQRLIHSYLRYRKSLVCAFVLLDVNLPLQKNDRAFINKLGEWQVPFVLVYTKADRLARQKLSKHIGDIEEALLEDWNALPARFVSSAREKEGREEILHFIHQTLRSLGRTVDG